ncbi:acetylxylan esterase [Urbifossiella limnaea]|uniref:Acetyl xylan esterase (AXE1) n=1 Tax=Urbifossiella limnaea TaxID=2528023 RepID=A0A517XNP6_9BACT|nr:acetylxylan esterase [Urbifossiella limnaea]QDU19129.1 Acetyl xylan esterase (AXE1) [Urbifossiella limnaea]
MHRCYALALSLLVAGTAAAQDAPLLPAGPTPPKQLLHELLLAECRAKFAARATEVEALRTPADIAARQDRLRKQFVAALGGFPDKTPLNARTVGTLKRDGYRIEKVIFESRPEHHVTANLYLPDGPGPFPAVLMPIGHSQTGKAADYVQRGCVLLVKNGFAALAYDPIGQGERVQLLDKLGQPAIKGSTSEHTMTMVGALPTGHCTASYRVWDGIRSLDYLCSRPEVDEKRLGCTGCSGGGTLTSYLMALDDRIAAAAPSCYLTSLDRLFSTIGPQDGEQNIPGQVAVGMDHADYVTMRAPKPTLVIAASKDFFDIKGTWDTFREASRVYAKLGFPERLSLVETDTSHGYPKSHREAAVRFFNRWLRGVDTPVTEGDFPIEKDADLRCTRTGNVIEDLKGRSVFDLNAVAADEARKQRKALDPAALRAAVAKQLGLTASPQTTVEKVGAEGREGYTLLKLIYRTDGGLPLPAVAFVPAKERRDGARVVLVHDGGKAAATADAEALAKAGRYVLALDLSGFGETAPGVAAPGRPNYFGVESRETFLSLHLSRPLLGRRVQDLMAVVKHLRSPADKEIELIGHGAAASVVLHTAALLPNDVAAVQLVGGGVSWDEVARTTVSVNQFAGVVPGALAVYDLPDLAASLSPRPLVIRAPKDAAGNAAPAALVERTFAPVRAAYAKDGADGRFTTTR